MKVGIGARVSTRDKDQNPENQLRIEREYCQKKGWEYEEYVDWESGQYGTEKRKKLDDMINDLQNNKLDGVVWLRVDRFSREPEVFYPLVGIIKKAGKFIEFAEDGSRLDSDTLPTADLMAGIKISVAKYERALIAMRIKESISRKKKEYMEKGKKWKWGRETIKIDHAKVLEMHADKKSIREIARAMGCSTSPIHRILKGQA